MNEPWASAVGGWGPVLLERAGLSDAPAAVKCSAVGHPWTAWEFLPLVGPGIGTYRRSCPACTNVEVRAVWA